MKNKIYIIVLFSIGLMGCPAEWYVDIQAGKSINDISICITVARNCNGRGVQLNGVTVAQALFIDDRFVDINTSDSIMWQISPRDNLITKEFSYGVVPDRWLENVKARPLAVNTIYSINYKLYFRIIPANGRFDVEVLYQY